MKKIKVRIVPTSTIKSMVENGLAENVTEHSANDYFSLEKEERGFTTEYQAHGICGIISSIHRGNKSGKLYGITDISSALYLYNCN